MKKSFTFAAALMLCVGVNADNFKLNNPTDPSSNNRPIVLWDCNADDFAASNNFEAGQTVTIAFDLEGTTWLDYLAETAPDGTTLIPAAHIWFDFEKAGKKEQCIAANAERLRKIRDNIYGVTINFAQTLDKQVPGNGAAATTIGEILYAYCMIHIANFKNADGTPGDTWWQHSIQIDYGAADCLFATLPSTGKNDPAFTGADYTPAMYIVDEPGYAAPCGTTATDLKSVREEAAAGRIIMKNGIMYIMDHAGAMHSMLGF